MPTCFANQSINWIDLKIPGPGFTTHFTNTPSATYFSHNNQLNDNFISIGRLSPVIPWFSRLIACAGNADFGIKLSFLEWLLSKADPESTFWARAPQIEKKLPKPLLICRWLTMFFFLFFSTITTRWPCLFYCSSVTCDTLGSPGWLHVQGMQISLPECSYHQRRIQNRRAGRAPLRYKKNWGLFL